MIIDADVHISPGWPTGSTITVGEALRRMDQAGVDRALTWLQPPYERGQIDAGNRYVFEATRAHPDRVIGFGWADPNLGADRAMSEVQRCLEEYGFPGVKLNGAQNEFVIDDERVAMPLIERIADAGAILALHIGGDSPERTHPWRLGRIASRFPDLRILMIHIGGAAFHDLSRACIEIAAGHPNVTLIGSAVRAQSILAAIRALGHERICFGSDTPFELMHVELAKYRALLDGELDDRQRADVLGGNIARVLGIVG